MVTKDIPMVIADESMKRLARRIGEDVEDGKLTIEMQCFGPFVAEPTRKLALYYAALTLTTELSRWN